MRILFLFFLVLSNCLFAQKAQFYNVIKGSNKESLLNQLEHLSKTKNINLKKGYEGAIHCKLASFEKLPKNKLAYFNKGVLELEGAIKQDPENIELRFLRLIIQENVPPLLKYNKDLNKDCSFIKNHFLDADTELKKIILEYAQKSTSLKL